MKRRELLLAASGAAGAASLSSVAAADEKNAVTKPEYYELRKYQLLNRSKQGQFNDFFSRAAIPAMSRIGIGPVGVFSVVYGPNIPTLTYYVLLPHKSLESFASANASLTADPVYQKAGADFLNAPYSDPAYVRMESSLMKAFDRMPRLELPVASKENKPRIFELRTYESHSLKAGKKKIEMFNEGGEIEIFRNTGLQPVFFGETLIGPQMPNLTYMLCFDNMTARDKNWETFVGSSEWQKLSVDPLYKDTVSNITDIILRSADYSQI
ncbi:MAG TPA: NIPSNAP family protein [archaeon]|nr:NIPSNAP family protein [archaeon]